MVKHVPNGLPVRELDYLNRRTGLDGVSPIYVVLVMGDARSPAILGIHFISEQNTRQFSGRSGHTTRKRGTHRES